VAGEKQISRSQHEETTLDHVDMMLVTFSTGMVSIPPISLVLTPAQGNSHTYKTPEVPIEIESILDRHKDRADIQDLKGPIGFFNPLPWILGALALTLLALLAWWISKRSPGRNLSKKPPEPARPPEEVAQHALERLAQRHLLESGHVKEFYIELSNIIRAYLEGRFDAPCLDRTTSEIMNEIKSHWLHSTDFHTLKELLQDCDLVKFARFVPTIEDSKRHVELARGFIDHTTTRQAPKPLGSHETSPK